MDEFKLALRLETDHARTIVAIEHIDCTIGPTVQFLGLALDSVLVGGGANGTAMLGGTTPCRFTTETSDGGFLTSVSLACGADPMTPKRGKVATIRRLVEIMEASEHACFTCCTLRPLRLNSADGPDTAGIRGSVLIQETLLGTVSDSAALVSELGSDVVLAVPNSSIEELEWLIDRTRERIAEVLTYDVDLRSGFSEIRFSDDPYLAIQRAEHALTAGLESAEAKSPLSHA